MLSIGFVLCAPLFRGCGSPRARLSGAVVRCADPFPGFGSLCPVPRGRIKNVASATHKNGFSPRDQPERFGSHKNNSPPRGWALLKHPRGVTVIVFKSGYGNTQSWSWQTGMGTTEAVTRGCRMHPIRIVARERGRRCWTRSLPRSDRTARGRSRTYGRGYGYAWYQCVDMCDEWLYL